jgi:carboxylesterase
VSRPFRVRGGTRGGALLVHGFTGSPYEMQPFAEPLAAAGFDVLGVRLPGHGARADGEPNEWAAWRAEVRSGIDELVAESPSRSRPVALVGLSMGALLALEVAADQPERVNAIVALSPAIQLPLGARLALRAGALLAPRATLSRPLPKGQSDIRDAQARAAHPVSPPFPLSAVLSFDALRRGVRARLGAVAKPMLIVHSRLDRTCTLAGAYHLARAARASAPEMHVLERSGHVLPVDVEGAHVTRLVLDFLERTVPQI